MAVHGLRSTGTCVSNGFVASGVNLISQNFSPGDVAWTKIHNEIWWPAQVVDEKSIGVKPKKKKKDQILARLYGSYEFLYMDPLICSMEFENIVKQNNITAKEVLQKSLDKELSQILSGSNSKKMVPHFGATSHKGKRQKKEITARNHKGNGSSAPSSSQKHNEVSSEKGKEDDATDRAASATNKKQDEAGKPMINKKYSRWTSKSNSIRRPNADNQDTTEIETNEVHGVKSTKRVCLRGSLSNTVNKDEMEKKRADQLNYQGMDKMRSETSSITEMEQLGPGQLKLKGSEQVKVNSLGEASKTESKKQVEHEICPDRIIAPVIVKQYVVRKNKHDDVKRNLRANARSKISKDNGKRKGKENHELRLLDSAVTVIRDRLRNRTKKNDPQTMNSRSGVPENNDIKQDDYGKQNAVRKDNGAASWTKNIKQSGSRKKMDKDAKELQNSSPHSAPEIILHINPRKTKVMQSLGLIAPSGSPFIVSGKS